jgi:hypothetical protein
VEAEQSVQPTGTNRSKPRDPSTASGPVPGAPITARVQRQAPDGRAGPGLAQDTFPHTNGAFTNSPRSRDRRSELGDQRSRRAGEPLASGAAEQARLSLSDLRHPTCGGGCDSLVATARGQTPDPIPNSAVKTLSADGTASQDAEEQVAARLSQPPPFPRPSRATRAASGGVRLMPRGWRARPAGSDPRINPGDWVPG